ncbi:MAG: DUF445 domain-containing protein [Bacteroidetes bacterium QS_8_68_15]|nr:MAG: DUF445 domain-containing protein [Bacteroidetes bacterium QS_8_68_15]
MPDDPSDTDRRWTSGDLSERGGGSGADGDAEKHPSEETPLPGRWPHARYDDAKADDDEGNRAADLSLPEAREVTRDRARDLETLLSHAFRRHWPASEADDETDAEPPRRTGLHAKALPLLRAVPWALAALFLFSFAWNFSGWTLRLFGRAWPAEGLLRIVSVSGLIGFATNWLAVTMLFQPRQERPLFGQGLIPAQKERVVWRLSEAISEDLINEDVVKEKIRRSGIVRRYREKAVETMHAVARDEAFRRDLKELAEGYAQRVLRAPAVQERIAQLIIERLEAHAARGGLGGLVLGTYRTLGEQDFRRRIDAIVRRLPESVEPALAELDLLLDRLPAHLEKRSDRFEEATTRLVLRFVENLDVERMVRERMEAYDERRLERLFKKTSNEQLNYIKYLGGILGAMGGLIIWAPGPALAFFALAGAVLWSVDEGLFRMQASWRAQ